MLAKNLMYSCMTVKQLNNQIEKIKVKLNNETDSEVKLKYYDEVGFIMGVLINKIKHNKKLVKDVQQSVNDLKTKNEQKQKRVLD